MKSTIKYIALLFVCLSAVLMAQVPGAPANGPAAGTTTGGGTSVPPNEDPDRPLELVTNVVLDDFEFANTWEGQMSSDQGIIILRRIPGGPVEVTGEDEGKDESEKKNKYILGAGVSYFRTGFHWFSVTPPRPIKILGIVKDISVWVAGRGNPHTLSFVIKDFYGRRQSLECRDKLTFIGWKKLDVMIPQGIPQDIHWTKDYGAASSDEMRRGLHFIGFRVDCDPRETWGEYKIYFDNLEAKRDIQLESPYANQPDDPVDDWDYY